MLPEKRIILFCSRGCCEMTLLFYSAAQIDEDKGMKERHERGQTEEATRRASHKSVGRILGTRLETGDYLTIMGVFRLYGAVGSFAEVRPLFRSERPRSRWTDGRGWSPQMLPHTPHCAHLLLLRPTRRVRTTLSNSGIKQVVVGKDEFN